MKFVGPPTITRKNDAGSDSVSLSMVGEIESSLPIFDQDNVDAFVLTYRQLIQNNDRISIGNLSKRVYASDWIFKEACENFELIRSGLNQYLDSAIFVQLSTEGTISRRQLVKLIVA